MQLIGAISSTWKNITKQNNDTFTTIQHHFDRNSRVLTVQKVTSKELYWILITTTKHKLASQKYFEKKFTDLGLDWREILITPHIVSSNIYMMCFQYKVLNNKLFINIELFLFKKPNSPLRYFCKDKDETVFHLYFYCPNVRNLWNQLNFYLAEDLTLPPQTLQAAVFGLSEKDNAENVIFYNHIFLTFKRYVYLSGEKRFFNLMSVVNQIMKIKKILKKETHSTLKKTC